MRARAGTAGFSRAVAAPVSRCIVRHLRSPCRQRTFPAPYCRTGGVRHARAKQL